MIELFPEGLRGGRARRAASSSSRTPTLPARSACGTSSAWATEPTSRTAGRTAGAASTGRSGSAASGSARRGRRRRPTRSRSSIDPGPRVRHRRPSDDAALPRAAAGARARLAARRRLRLRRALGRRRAARPRAGARRRHRGAVDRRDARERRAERRRARRAARERRRAAARRRRRPSRTSRSTPCRRCPARIDAAGAADVRLLPLGAARPRRLQPRRRGARTTAGPRICTAARKSYDPRRGDVPRRLPGLQGLARRRARGARGVAARRPRRARGWGGRRGDQHLLRHERGARQVAQGGSARRTQPRPCLRDGLRREPRRRALRRPARERRRRREAQRGDRRRSSQATSVRSAACRPMRASIAFARS